MKCLVILVIICLYSVSAKYPVDLNKCKPADNECITKTATAVLKVVTSKTGGYPAIGVPSLDPLYIKNIRIKQGEESPVNIELNFIDSDLIGISTVEFYKTTGFGKDPAGIHELYYRAPQLGLIGDYTINGKILIIPIQGVGKCNLTLENPTGILKFRGKKIEKNGKTHLKVDKLRFTFNTTRLHMYLGNLFNGDKALGDNTNLFLNENWEDIFNELKKNLWDGFGQVMQSVIEGFYNKIPYEETYLTD